MDSSEVKLQQLRNGRVVQVIVFFLFFLFFAFSIAYFVYCIYSSIYIYRFQNTAEQLGQKYNDNYDYTAGVKMDDSQKAIKNTLSYLNDNHKDGKYVVSGSQD